MKIKPLLNWIRVSFVAGFFLTQSGVCFPPAPDHVVLGMVRNEFGEPIQQEGASVILTSDSRSIRTSIAPDTADTADQRALRVSNSFIKYTLRFRGSSNTVAGAF